MARSDSYDYVVVDAQNFAIRYWEANKDRRTKFGVESGLQYGFVTKLLDMARRYSPARFVIVWDGVSRRLRSIDPSYKIHKAALVDVEDSLPEKFRSLRDAFSHWVLTLWDKDSEADELIARFVHSVPWNCNVLIVSGDKDFHQLVSSRVTILEKSLSYRDEPAVRDIWGVEPFQVPLVRAIQGDVSDCLKGVSRIRKETVKRIVEGCCGVETLITSIKTDRELTNKEREKLLQAEETIRRNVALMDLSQVGSSWDQYRDRAYNRDYIFGMCRDLELGEALRSKSWACLH